MLVNGLEEVIVSSPEQVFQLLKRSQQKRRVAETNLNKNSSRSHYVFTITIHGKETAVDGDDVIRTGKLYLVDLAGSECIGRSGAKDQRAQEAGKINQSLLTLGRVINALVEKQGYIPYRDSKLTRLLQESLGGRAKTCIIATVSPSAVCVEESLSTLAYAHRAKKIKNKPQVNEKLSKKSYFKDLVSQIARLKAENEALRMKNGVYLPADQYEELTEGFKAKCSQLEEAEFTLHAKEKEVDELKEMFEVKNTENKELQNQIKETTLQLEVTKDFLAETRLLLSNTKLRLEETEYIVSHQAKTEKMLADEAAVTHATMTGLARDKEGLLAKVARLRRSENTNFIAMNKFAQKHEKETDDLKVVMTERMNESSHIAIKTSEEMGRKINEFNQMTQKIDTAVLLSRTKNASIAASIADVMQVYGAEVTKRTNDELKVQCGMIKAVADQTKAVQEDSASRIEGLVKTIASSETRAKEIDEQLVSIDQYNIKQINNIQNMNDRVVQLTQGRKNECDNFESQMGEKCGGLAMKVGEDARRASGKLTDLEVLNNKNMMMTLSQVDEMVKQVNTNQETFEKYHTETRTRHDDYTSTMRDAVEDNNNKSINQLKSMAASITSERGRAVAAFAKITTDVNNNKQLINENHQSIYSALTERKKAASSLVQSIETRYKQAEIDRNTRYQIQQDKLNELDQKAETFQAKMVAQVRVYV